MFPPMTLRGAIGLIALIWLRLLDPAGLAWAGGYTVRPSQPTVQYNANLNSGYLSSAITPSLVNTQIADQGIPQNSTTAATGFNWNQVYAGDPVNLVTGNFYHNERDIHIPGRGGLDLVFERSYNSHNPKDGPLGFGWTHSFNQYLTFIRRRRGSSQNLISKMLQLAEAKCPSRGQS